MEKTKNKYHRSFLSKVRYKRRTESEMFKIITEIHSGLITKRDASTNYNDVIMIIIRGDKRAADIYFTEFNRLFNHHYFRSVYKKAKEQNHTNEESFILLENDKWLEKYDESKFR